MKDNFHYLSIMKNGLFRYFEHTICLRYDLFSSFCLYYIQFLFLQDQHEMLQRIASAHVTL